jgi:NAD(P)-dependent dehydrogenase (short-subunit alcohol dehydrogenase family)
MSGFNDLVAIVTGGASGIGRALCEELGARGAIVVVADLDSPGANAVALAIGGSGGHAEAAELDTTDAARVQQLVQITVAKHGRLDLMFNNAGIAVVGEALDTSLEQWRRIVDVDLLGVVYGTAAAYAVMVRQGGGHIVNTASFAGLVSHAGMAAYCMAKHGVVGLSGAMRIEGAARGVKVSAVCPGIVATGIQQSATLLNVERKDVLAMVPVKAIEARDAARRILKGVARNRGTIVFPYYARLLWWVQRLCPALLAPLHRRSIADFRALRRTPPV